MPPKRTFKRKYDASAKSAGKSKSGDNDAQGPQIQFDLGTEKKKATVRKFKNMKLVDIREYYQKDKEGPWLPGSKGISLTQEQWAALVSRMIDIGEALIKIDDREEFETLKTLLESKKKALEANTETTDNANSKSHQDEEDEEDLDDVEFEDVSEAPASKKPKVE